MKETPTEERLEKGAEIPLPKPLNTTPTQQHDRRQQSTATNSNQPEAAAPSTQNGHISSSPPKQTHTPPEQTHPSTAQPSPPSPPIRAGHRSRRIPYTRREKVIIWSLLIVAFVAALPIGAYLTMKITERQQQAQPPVAYPVGTEAIAASPRVLDQERREAQYIDQMIAHMTLDEELGQMIIVQFTGDTFNSDLQYMLVNQHAGGTILYASNVQTIAQTQALDAASQAHAQIPLFISTDQEGGLVNRLKPITGGRPSAQQIGDSNNPNLAHQQGTSDGQILSQLGINLNLAPVVDVQTISNSATIIPTRMFGTTAAKVVTFAGDYLVSLQDQGVIGCLKHWPGLGAATVDPHDALPIFNRSQANLNNIDFAPYRALIAQGDVDMIMSTHELVPAYDPNLPATVSPIMIDQVLRHDLGYQGVVITDGLYMGALAQRWTVAQAAVLAVIAGNDLLLGPWNHVEVQKVLDALHAAINSGQITKARIDLSMQRILALKIKYGLITVPANFGQN